MYGNNSTKLYFDYIQCQGNNLLKTKFKYKYLCTGSAQYGKDPYRPTNTANVKGIPPGHF